MDVIVSTLVSELGELRSIVGKLGLGTAGGEDLELAEAGVSPGSVHHLLCDLEHATVLPEHDRVGRSTSLIGLLRVS